MSLSSDIQGKSPLEQQKIVIAAYQAADLPTDFVYDGIHIVASEIAFEDFKDNPEYPSLKVRAEAWVGEERVDVDNPMNWIGLLAFLAPDGTYSTVDDGYGSTYQQPNYVENVPLSFQIEVGDCIKGMIK